jgi:uncharacterized DUF497 family protein
LNKAKHGLSLALSAELDWEDALVWVDDREDYEETRIVALAPKTGILYFVAYVDRGRVRRIISLRRANRREVKHYVQAI